MNNDVAKVLTKTKHIHDALTNGKYSDEPLKCIIGTNKQRARKNMKGTIPEICNECLVPDDENHRLNYCKKWTIRDENDTPYDFCDIYSDDPGTVDGIIDEVEKVWETRYANGRMKRI